MDDFQHKRMVTMVGPPYRGVGPINEVKELSLDHVSRERLGGYLPPYLDRMHGGGSMDPRRYAEKMIADYCTQNNETVIQSKNPSIHDDIFSDRTIIKFDNEPLQDFYGDYKKHEDKIFTTCSAEPTSNTFDPDNIKTYIKDISFERNSGRIDISLDSFRLETRNVEPLAFPDLTDPEEWYNPYETMLEEGGRKYEKQKKLKSNLTIIIKSRAQPISNAPLNERVAIDTLREMITEEDFRKYVKYGFILVHVKNLTYQIFRKDRHTKVWYKGKVIREVCVRLKSSTNVPPTDNVIAFKVMVETDPESFEQLGNVYHMEKAA